jgi:hypothetical protein
MENRRDDTPVINDYTYYVFEEIEKRGLQFAIPPQWRPVYRAFLKERKRRLTNPFWGIVGAFREFQDRSESGSYKDDFGDKGTTATQESRPSANTTGLLEE